MVTRNSTQGYYRWKRTYDKFGIVGFVLMGIAVVAMLIGGVISFLFFRNNYELFLDIINGKVSNANSINDFSEFIGGVVGTVWSLAGVLLFFLALRLQSKELSLQIKELKDTREVFVIQQFENTFFNLIKTQQEIRQNATFDGYPIAGYSESSYGAVQLQSTEVFEYIRFYMRRQYEKLNSLQKMMNFDHDNVTDQVLKNKQAVKMELIRDFQIEDLHDLDSHLLKAKAIYRVTFQEFHNTLSHYFRNLYHILSYLKDNEDRELLLVKNEIITGERDSLYMGLEPIELTVVSSKYKKYSQFIQAQMSSAELFLLFYNALFFKKLKYLIHHYNFLENLNTDDLLNQSTNASFYCEYLDGQRKVPAVSFKSRQEILSIK